MSNKKFWLFVVCEHCGYQNSFRRVGINKDGLTVEEYKDLFSEKKCSSCGKSLVGGIVYYYLHPDGLIIIDHKYEETQISPETYDICAVVIK